MDGILTPRIFHPDNPMTCDKETWPKRPLHERLAAGCKAISFDYADRLDLPLVESTLPFVDYGFYSYHKERDAFIEGFLKDKVDRGMKIAVATFGDKGSLAYDGKEFTSFGIFPAEQVVNTVGAGDSFTATLVADLLKGAPVGVAHEHAVQLAAYVCTQQGAMAEWPEALRL